MNRKSSAALKYLKSKMWKTAKDNRLYRYKKRERKGKKGKGMKANPKSFNTYFIVKTKNKDRVGSLSDTNDETITDSMGMRNVLNEFFCLSLY